MRICWYLISYLSSYIGLIYLFACMFALKILYTALHIHMHPHLSCLWPYVCYLLFSCEAAKSVACLFTIDSSFALFFTANIHLHEDILKISWIIFKTSSRCLDQHQYIHLVIRLQDVFKTSCENVFKASSRHFQDVFKTTLSRLARTSSRRL